MITKFFKNALAIAFNAVVDNPSSVQPSTIGLLLCRDVTGHAYYLSGRCGFPGAGQVTAAVTLNENSAGISIGAGTTPPSEDNYNLEQTITSGVNLTLTSGKNDVDANGNPYTEYLVTVTNTSEEPITITEIGYKQTVKAVDKPLTNYNNANRVILIDRTMLDSPLTLEPTDAGVIVYKLKTIPEVEKYVAGVKMVSFTYGSDEEVAAMIDAARQGLIDLRSDGGWCVGDVRKIHVGNFTGGDQEAHAEEDVAIAISSFEEYNDCGNLFQFDFFTTLTGSFRYSTSSNLPNYGDSLIYNETLPAMVEALPTWLKTRLITFPVKVTDFNDRTIIHTVNNNKLASRATNEIAGKDYHDPSALYPAEGDLVDMYSSTFGKAKSQGYNSGSNDKSYSLRTSGWYASGGNNFSGWYGARSTVVGLAPFGCL